MRLEVDLVIDAKICDSQCESGNFLRLVGLDYNAGWATLNLDKYGAFVWCGSNNCRDNPSCEAGPTVWSENQLITITNPSSGNTCSSASCFMIMAVTNGIVYAQYTTFAYYSPCVRASNATVELQFNSGLFAAGSASPSAPAPYEYQRCNVFVSSPGVTVTSRPSTGYCTCLSTCCQTASAACSSYYIASPAGSPLALVSTLDAALPFSNDTRITPQGISPRTNINSPRLAILPIVCIPYLGSGQNVTLPLSAVDEDGATIPAAQFSPPSTPYATVVGSTLVVSALPTQILGVTLTYASEFVLFPIRVVVVDPVGQTAAGKASTSFTQFYLRACQSGGPVPVDYTTDGVQVRYGVGDTTPIFAQSGRCQRATTPLRRSYLRAPRAAARAPETSFEMQAHPKPGQSAGFEVQPSFLPRTSFPNMPTRLASPYPSAGPAGSSGRCVVAGGDAPLAGANGSVVQTAGDCQALGGQWDAAWLSAPPRTAQCVVTEPCVLVVAAVKLRLTSARRCTWSDAAAVPSVPSCASLVMSAVSVTVDSSQAALTGEHEVASPAPGWSANPSAARVALFAGRPAQPLPYEFDIGRQEVLCFQAMANDTAAATGVCWSLPFCVIVAVAGRPTVLLSPASSPTCPNRNVSNAGQFSGGGACPDMYTCWQSESVTELALSASYPDRFETVSVSVDSITTLGVYAAAYTPAPAAYSSQETGETGSADCASKAAQPGAVTADLFFAPSPGRVCGDVQLRLAFDLRYEGNGSVPAPGSPVRTVPAAGGVGGGAPAFAGDKLLCYTVSDNQARCQFFIPYPHCKNQSVIVLPTVMLA